MKIIKCLRCGKEILKDHNCRVYCENCAQERILERRRVDGKRWRVANKEEHNRRNREYNRKHSQTVSKRTREWGLRNRNEVLSHYGNKCACCGEETKEFLSIDHINGGGTQHRRQIRENIYRWLRRKGFPEGFRILCHNCNMAKAFYGKCPHEKSI